MLRVTLGLQNNTFTYKQTTDVKQTVVFYVMTAYSFGMYKIIKH